METFFEMHYLKYSRGHSSFFEENLGQCSASNYGWIKYTVGILIIIYLLIIFILLVILKTTSFYFLNKNKSAIYSLVNTFTFIPKILLQQIAYFGLWFLFLKNYFSIEYDYIVGGLVFSIAHFYLFYKLRKIDALTLTLSSLFGGFFFIYLYSHYELGFYFSFLVHIMFHVILDIIFLFLKLKPMAERS